MQQTYVNFKNLSSLHTGTTNFNELALEYQSTENPAILAFCFCQQYPYIVSQVSKYFNLTEDDKASFAVEELHKSLLDYCTSKGASARTLFSRYLNRRMYAETNMLNHQKRSANNSASCYESLVEENSGFSGATTSDDFTNTIDLYESMRKAGCFTDNEIKYCKIILTDSEITSDSDAAKLLGVSPSAIFQLKKRLKKKFSLNLAM